MDRAWRTRCAPGCSIGSRVPARSGTGLGLSIAKWAVEANGGRLTFDPRPGSGQLVSALRCRAAGVWRFARVAP